MKMFKLNIPKFNMGVESKDFFLSNKVNEIILNQAKKEKNIVYGARSIQAQGGLFSRYTQDWDILSKKPKNSALKTETALDKLYGSNQFYVKPALHPGTHKVMNKGNDKRKGTEDDYGIVDYTTLNNKGLRYRNINGIRYRNLSQEKKAKYKALRDKTQQFRWEKDREDLERIKLIQGTSK